MAASGTRGFWPMRDLPVVGWLVAALVVALAHPFLPAPRWLLIHLVLLGAVTHSVLVWSRYFTDALLHLPPDPGDRRRQDRRLVLLDLGVLTVVGGVVTARWPATVVGGTAVGIAVLWHGAALLHRLRTALPARFGLTVRYYVAAAALLPAGVTIGVVAARVHEDPWHQRLLVAHASVNLLGWLGLVALGTLVTLWPTMLRTRVAPGTERAATRALPPLVLGVVTAAGGALTGQLGATALGLAIYLAGMGLLAPALLSAARAKPPTGFATLSVASALAWLVGCLVALVVALGTASSWDVAADRFEWFTPLLAAGFGAQLLLGALSYLVPVALGGGPRPVRAATAVLDRAAGLRVAATDAGLLLCALPVPAPVRVLCSTVVLLALASFLPLLVLAIRTSRAVRAGVRESPPVTTPPPRRLRRQAAAGVCLVTVAALAGVAVDQVGLASFSDGLVVRLTNTDTEDVHDLVLDDGSDTGRLSPGESARIDVGVVGRDVAGWCSIVGHRQMGMTFAVHVEGAPSGPETSYGRSRPGPPSAWGPTTARRPARRCTGGWATGSWSPSSTTARWRTRSTSTPASAPTTR